MKKIIALLLAVLLLAGMCACGSKAAAPAAAPEAKEQTDLEYVKANKKMIIGYTVYEPMNYTDEKGEFTGFDTELAKAVCAKLGVEPEFIIINWDTKEVALEARDIDCIWNGLTLNAEREANMACTVPYVKNAQVVVMKAGADYKDTSSLVGKTVCAEIGSAGELLIKGDDSDPEDIVEPDPNLAQSEYVGKSVQTDCLMEVKSGTADAAVLDLTLANSMTGAGTNYSDLVIVDHLAEEAYGVAFRKGSDIRDAVNEIFAAMVKDGSMKTLADKYGLDLA